jgi:hypothetical protein
MRVLSMLILAAGLTLSVSHAAHAQPAKKEPAAPVAPTDVTQQRITSIWDALIETGDAAQASTDIDAVLRSLAAAPIAKPSPADADLLAAARVRRLVALAAAAAVTDPDTKPDASRKPARKPAPNADDAKPKVKALATLLRGHPRFAETLAWGMTPHDKLPRVAALVTRLADAQAPLDRLPTLAAAVVLVHDDPDPRAKPWSASPESILAHFAGAKRLGFDLESLPVTLAAHVVDAVVSSDELAWAAGSFGGNRAVGKMYHQIQYDTQAFKYGKPKRIAELDYTLRNIKQVGGVCVEQAYYAEMVGKAIGVPTATIVARGDDVGHAWVAYLRTQGRRVQWDLTEGRYRDYRGESASTRDPQTSRAISDGDLSMKAARAGYAADVVALSLALADAAALAPDRAASLNILERAVNVCPYVPESWDRVLDLARKDAFDRADLERWGGAVIKFCGTDYPDFAIKVMAPMVAGLSDQSQAAAAWAWIRERVVESQNNRSYYRHDLAVSLRLREADCRAAAGDHDGAWKVCWEAVRKFAADTPAVQEVAMRCERMLLTQQAAPGRIASFWKDAWAETIEPKGMAREYALASNWSVFGLKYAEWLSKAGNDKKADEVRNQILPKNKGN